MKVSWEVPSSVAAPSLEVESSPGAAPFSEVVLSSEAAEPPLLGRRRYEFLLDPRRCRWQKPPFRQRQVRPRVLVGVAWRESGIIIFAVKAKLRPLHRVDGLRDIHLGINCRDRHGIRTRLPFHLLQLIHHAVLSHLEELRLELLFTGGLFRAVLTDAPCPRGATFREDLSKSP